MAARWLKDFGGFHCNEKALALCKHCSAITNTISIIITAFSTNPKQSPILSILHSYISVKKINSASEKNYYSALQDHPMTPLVLFQ